MSPDEFAKLKIFEEIENPIKGFNLINKFPRTLLYGYTFDRNTYHVYLYEDKIYNTVYSNIKNVNVTFSENNIINNAEYLTDVKRLYPELCDYEFCQKLKDKGFYLSFTTWDEVKYLQRKKEAYHGLIHTWFEELSKPLV